MLLRNMNVNIRKKLSRKWSPLGSGNHKWKKWDDGCFCYKPCLFKLSCVTDENKILNKVPITMSVIKWDLDKRVFT